MSLRSQGNGTRNITGSPVLFQQYVQHALGGLATLQNGVPLLTMNGSTNASDPAVLAAAAARDPFINVTVSCHVPRGTSGVVPAVLWSQENPGETGGAASYWLSPGDSSAKMGRVAVVGISPRTGPDTGTNITLEARTFTKGATTLPRP